MAIANSAFGTGDFAVEFWVFGTTNDDRRPLISNRRNATGTPSMWSIEIYNVPNRVEFHNGQSILLTATNLLASSSWNHVAVTRSGMTLSMYINGVFSGSTSNSNDFSEINDIQIGRDILPPAVGDLKPRFQGALDEVKIFNRALTTNEIAQSAGITYSVTYDGSGNDGGSVPTDFNSPYIPGTSVSVLGNSGPLVKTGNSFAGWNTAVNGSGTSYSASDTFIISANITLYAKWAINTYTVTASATGSGTITSTASHPYGSSPTYTATPDGGSHIRSISIDGILQYVADSLTPSSHTFSTIAADHAIAATFAANTAPGAALVRNGTTLIEYQTLQDAYNGAVERQFHSTQKRHARRVCTVCPRHRNSNPQWWL